jgi:hypothetical protein
VIEIICKECNTTKGEFCLEFNKILCDKCYTIYRIDVEEMCNAD